MLIYEENDEMKCDFQQIYDNLRRLLELENINQSDFVLDNSPKYDEIRVSFVQQFPLFQAPVEHSIQYSCSSVFGKDCCYAASVGVPRGEVNISHTDCYEIAAGCSECNDMTVSFERYYSGKGIGVFHVIHTIYDKHISDVKDMQDHMHKVRYTIVDIANRLAKKSAELFLNGKCNTSGTLAKFEQLNSIHEDDRMIPIRDLFAEIGYDVNDPINAEDTVDYTEMFTSSDEFQNEIDKK